MTTLTINQRESNFRLLTYTTAAIPILSAIVLLLLHGFAGMSTGGAIGTFALTIAVNTAIIVATYPYEHEDMFGQVLMNLLRSFALGMTGFGILWFYLFVPFHTLEGIVFHVVHGVFAVVDICICGVALFVARYAIDHYVNYVDNRSGIID